MKKILIIICVAMIILTLAGAFYFISKNSQNEKSSVSSNPSTLATTPMSASATEIPSSILNAKFGFLGQGSEDTGEDIVSSGASWVRPHPGQFVWDMMQSSSTAEIDFVEADASISGLQSNKLGILVTIWPFAEWDQAKLANASNCEVSKNDEFLNANDKKGRGAYLPLHRCNPSDWTAYKTWVAAVVERYDGDGLKDMPGLKYPVKHWEVMNEPDLNYANSGAMDMSDRLNFYQQGPTEYGELLKQSYSAIKSSDATSAVLIAGAAGGEKRQLSFYQALFSKYSDISSYFDIGNVHCISNDQRTHDFNVTAYKAMLVEAKITDKDIWVTEAEASYEGQNATQNYESTKTSVAGAINAGAKRIFFTRYQFDDFRTDMSKSKDMSTSFDNAAKYKELISLY